MECLEGRNVTLMRYYFFGENEESHTSMMEALNSDLERRVIAPFKYEYVSLKYPHNAIVISFKDATMAQYEKLDWYFSTSIKYPDYDGWETDVQT
jgi:hypothetical protein